MKNPRSDASGLLMSQNTAPHVPYDITAFGEILIDFTAQGCNEEGQTLYARNAGGAPANVAVAAAKLGAHTAFLGKVGQDMHGQFLQEVLKKEKVETKGLRFDARYFTTLAFVNIDSAGERTFAFARKSGADTKIQREELDPALLDHTHIFHVGSLSLTDEPARDAAFYAVERAKSNGSLISYDPNYRASLWEDEQTAKKYMRSLIPYADLMKISEEETVLLTDCSDAQEAARALYAQGVSVVVVTLGGQGAYVYSKAGGRMVAGFPTQHLTDTTGAGDSFWGGFLYQICAAKKPLAQMTLDELAAYARFANAAASLCVEKNGAIPAMPTFQQVEARLKNNRPNPARHHP